jgi:acyl-CoA oxidase
MDRLSSVKSGLSAPKTHYVDSAVDYLRFGDLLTPEEEAFRLQVRQLAEKEIAPYINDSIETASFPEHLMPVFRKSEYLFNFLKKPYGKGTSLMGQGVATAELARVDGSICTFSLVQAVLAMYTIEQLGSEEQKQKYLSKMGKLELISGWGLTEGKIGSDASSLETTVVKVPGGYRLNGDKRWIGNGNRDLLIVWARNQENNKVEGFILDMKLPGITTQVIKHKLPLRMVQNCHIHFNNVIVPEDCKLPKAMDFQKGTSVVLKHSRVFVAWAAVGIALGVYDNVIKYISNRKQFGVPTSSFQLMQEKLSRIMATTQAMLLMVWRITKLMEQNNVTIGQIGMTKAWITLRGREVCALGREMLGGNGITFDNYVMKAMADMEAMYTYEGTYDVNSLVNGRELTGIAAFNG